MKKRIMLAVIGALFLFSGCAPFNHQQAAETQPSVTGYLDSSTLFVDYIEVTIDSNGFATTYSLHEASLTYHSNSGLFGDGPAYYSKNDPLSYTCSPPQCGPNGTQIGITINGQTMTAQWFDTNGIAQTVYLHMATRADYDSAVNALYSTASS